MYAVVVGTYAGSKPFSHVGVVAARIEIVQGAETEASELSLYVDPETQQPVYSGVVRACDIAAADMIGKLSEPGLQKLLGFCDNASIRKAFIDGHGESSKTEKRGRDLDRGQGVGTGDEKQLRALQLTERSHKERIEELEAALAHATDKGKTSTESNATRKRKRDDEMTAMTKTAEKAFENAAKKMKFAAASPVSLKAADANKLRAFEKKLDDLVPLLTTTGKRLADFDDIQVESVKRAKTAVHSGEAVQTDEIHKRHEAQLGKMFTQTVTSLTSVANNAIRGGQPQKLTTLEVALQKIGLTADAPDDLWLYSDAQLKAKLLEFTGPDDGGGLS
jgi:hypothetical protein